MNERNPARQLLRIFEEWDAAILTGQGATEARGWNKDAGEVTERHVRAWSYLGDISQTIDGLSALNIDMGASKTYLPQWGKMAASVDVSWSNATGASSAFPSDALSQLQSLATIIDLAGAQIQPANLDLLSNVVEQVIDLLGSDESLSDHLRAYLVKLVREIRNALEDEKVGGGFNFADAAERLWVAMQAASAQSEQSAAQWKDTAAKLLPQAVVGVLTHMGVVGFDGVMKALGS